jgi:hypothetical protein
MYLFQYYTIYYILYTKLYNITHYTLQHSNIVYSIRVFGVMSNFRVMSIYTLHTPTPQWLPHLQPHAQRLTNPYAI